MNAGFMDLFSNVLTCNVLALSGLSLSVITDDHMVFYICIHALDTIVDTIVTMVWIKCP